MLSAPTLISFLLVLALEATQAYNVLYELQNVKATKYVYTPTELL
jgi:hypothetical protein